MKTLSLYRPFDAERPLFDMERFVDSFLNTAHPHALGRNVGRYPAVDVLETDDAYVLEAELPGFEEKDVEVNVDNNVLSIESRFVDGAEDKGGEKQFIIRERSTAQFSRSFKLPENADTEAVEAVFKNGLLRMEIKKRAEAKKRVIQIGK
jgi:HSP20 family molecular chaperone IbpA